jgi:hypothetical protein
MRVAVPNWWVLEGDRLGVWCDSNCAGGALLPAQTLGHLAVPDLPSFPSQYFPQTIAIRAVM